MSLAGNSTKSKRRAVPAAPAEDAAARRLSSAAQLSRAIFEALLSGVQRTTELNWQAARMLLDGAHAGNWRDNAEQAAQAWRLSARAYRICSTTAAQMLELVQTHLRSDTEEVWRVLIDADWPGIAGERAAELKRQLLGVQSALAAYTDAVIKLQQDVVALAQEEPRR